MDTKHTPTPWAVYEHDPLVIVDEKGSSLGEMVPGDPYISPDEAVANTALAVRAVNAYDDMLAALKGLLANLAEGDFISETRIDAARAAISKAEGK